MPKDAGRGEERWSKKRGLKVTCHVFRVDGCMENMSEALGSYQLNTCTCALPLFLSSRALIRSSLDLDVEAAQKSRLEMNPTMPVELRVNLPHVTRQPDTEKMLLAIDTGEVL